MQNAQTDAKRLFRRRQCAQGISGAGISYSGYMKIADMKAGESAKVVAVEAEKELKGRLAMLNIYPGAAFTLVRRAPFGGGIMLEAGGVRLALRKGVAERIVAVSLAEEEERKQ